MSRVLRYLRSAIEAIRESLFFVPGLIIIGAGLAAYVALRVDDTEVISTESIPLMVTVNLAGARTILATVAGATMTVAGIVFAMTAVTVQLAASNYSPRIVREFQRDRFQQVVIGAAAGTFTFCLLAMSSIGISPSEDVDGVVQPRLTVTLGVVFGVVTIVAIVAFIDHVVRRVRVDQVIRNTADDTTSVIERVVPEESPGEPLMERDLPKGHGRAVPAPSTGWIRTLDHKGLADHLPEGARLRLDTSVGGFVTKHLPMATVWVDGEGEPDVDIDDYIEIGRTRSLEQDPTYGIQLLVDIALRALSPGINDPTTAVSVVRHLERPLFEVLRRQQTRSVVYGEGERVVFDPTQPGHDDYVVMSLRPIITAGKGSTPVLLAVVDVMDRIRRGLDVIDRSERARHLDPEAELIATEAVTLPDPDRTAVRDRLAAAGFEA